VLTRYQPPGAHHTSPAKAHVGGQVPTQSGRNVALWPETSNESTVDDRFDLPHLGDSSPTRGSQNTLGAARPVTTSTKAHPTPKKLLDSPPTPKKSWVTFHDKVQTVKVAGDDSNSANTESGPGCPECGPSPEVGNSRCRCGSIVDPLWCFLFRSNFQGYLI